MNKYIFITPTILNMGGSILYTSRKIEWLESLGWEVDVYYYAYNNKQKILSSNLIRYKQNEISELYFSPKCFTQKRVESVINQILSNEFSYDRLIIESHTIKAMEWGECVANVAKGKHITYLVSELFQKINIRIESLLQFKLSQNLLFGITPRSIPNLLNLEDKYNNLTHLRAIGCASNNVEDISNNEIDNIKKADFNILSLGRLDKGYVVNMINDIVLFANEYCNININLYIVGDTRNKKLQSLLLRRLHKCRNLRTYYLGELLPIPYRIFELSDVCIASAGCVSVASLDGNVLTISVDANDYKAIGVFGLTTKNTIFRTDEKQVEIKDLLTEIYTTDNYRQLPQKRNRERVKLDYSTHLNVINSDFDYNYHILSECLNRKERIFKVLLKFLPVRSIYKYRGIIKNFI